METGNAITSKKGGWPYPHRGLLFGGGANEYLQIGLHVVFN